MMIFDMVQLLHYLLSHSFTLNPDPAAENETQPKRSINRIPGNLTEKEFEPIFYASKLCCSNGNL